MIRVTRLMIRELKFTTRETRHECRMIGGVESGRLMGPSAPHPHLFPPGGGWIQKERGPKFLGDFLGRDTGNGHARWGEGVGWGNWDK